MNNLLQRIRGILLHPLALGFGLLVLYGFLNTWIVGPIGYVADGLLLLDKAYWDRIPQAYHLGAVQLVRPMMTVYTITAMKLFNYSSWMMHLAGYTTLALIATSAAIVLLRAFPGRRLYAITTAIVLFFMPVMGQLVHLLSADNTRLVILFFLWAVIAFQHWAVNPRLMVLPALPIILLCLSAFAYESAVGLYLTIPLLLIPIYARHNADRAWWQHIWFLAEIAASVGIAMALFLFIRFLYGISTSYEQVAYDSLSDGSSFALLGTFGKMLAGIPNMLFGQIRLLPFSVSATLTGLFIVAAIAALLITTQRRQSEVTTQPRWFEGNLYILLTAFIMAIFGMLPFVLTAYSAEERIYSSATIGMSMLIAGLTFIQWRQIQIALITGLAILCGFWGAAAIQDGFPEHAAYQVRQRLHQSLYDTVPGVQPDTTIFVINVDEQSPDTGAVMSVVGTQDYMRMFYQIRNLNVFALNDEIWRAPIVSDDGFFSIDTGTVPLDSLVILWRSGDTFTLIDEITPDDKLNIIWEDGHTLLNTNPDQIITDPETKSRFWDIVGINYE